MNGLFYHSNETLALSPIPVNGTVDGALWLALGKKLKNAQHGAFNRSGPCQLLPYFAEHPPDVSLTE